MNREPTDCQKSLTHSEEKDEILVRKTLEGDSSAFDILVTRYRDRVYALACHMLWDSQEAEDIAQDVFVRAYRNLSKFRYESAFFTWLYRIAVNLVYTQARKAARRREIHQAAFVEFQVLYSPGGPTPEEEAAHEELRSMILMAIKQLDPRFRQVLVMKELEGMDVAEVADILKVPVGTVKSRLYRAREDLRLKIQSMRQKEKKGRMVS